MDQFEKGKIYSNFLLERIERNSEIDSIVYLFSHREHGTRVMAIKNSDANKTFCVAFTTIPGDSTGVAHILEHSVLMGSRKYPVRDVFGEINKGGLMTFLNAMTGADTTWYPFATLNLREYFNIMDVYCDVVFNPLLKRTTFEQEGWHYHKEGREDPIQFQGVVLNEMKGAYSDPIRLIFHNTFRGLMPGSTYAFESGGDPQKIPDLSYEEFTAFHGKFYHPANATFFFYGNAPLADELAFVDERFLGRRETRGSRAVINAGKNLEEPLLITDTYSVEAGSDLNGKTFISVASAVGTVLERKRNAAFQVIANILYNSDGSPLKRRIVGKGLGKDFGGMFLDSSCFKTIMMTYLVGSDPDQHEPFQEEYRKCLSEIVETGLDRDLVLSELNKYEFAVREEMCKPQRGLDLIGKALPALRHDADPFSVFRIGEMFKKIRKQALEGDYFEELIHTNLIDNPAPVVVVLKPDPDKARRLQRKEQQRLAAHERSLDEEGMAALIRRTRELITLQQTPNDEKTLSLLPRLTLADLDRSPEFRGIRAESVDGCEYLVCEEETNSICYFNLGFDCRAIDATLLPYLDLFGTIVTEIGTDKLDYMRFAKEINTVTGGFSHSFRPYVRYGEGDTVRPIFWLHAKMLSIYLERALDLIIDLFTSVSFADRTRIREIVQREFAWAEHAVQSEGYNLASSRVFSHLSPAGKYNELVGGLTQYQCLKNLARNYDRREKAFLETLERLKEALLVNRGLVANVTAAAEDVERVRERLGEIRRSLGAGNREAAAGEFPSFVPSQAFITSAEVVYNAQGGNLAPGGMRHNGHFEVLKTWLSRDYLWNTVRQLGGAYGCFVQSNSITGNICLISYRDPAVASTYEAYDRIGVTIENLELPPASLEQLIIGAYGNYLPHQGPAARGATARNEYLSGITKELKQKWLDELLSTTVDDLRAFGPAFARASAASFRATIGNRAKIEAHPELFDEIIEI